MVRAGGTEALSRMKKKNVLVDAKMWTSVGRSVGRLGSSIYPADWLCSYCSYLAAIRFRTKRLSMQSSMAAKVRLNFVFVYLDGGVR